MDGLLAKRVLIALAKKFSYDSIRRVNCIATDSSTSVPKKIQGYQLHLTRNGHSLAQLVVHPIDTEYCSGINLELFISKSAKWENLLNGLVGNTVSIRPLWHKERFRHESFAKNVVHVACIEQLMINLELEGHFKNA